MAVEVRERETFVHETGVNAEPRRELTYELGAEIDGAWVPFASVTSHRVEDYKQRAEREAASAEKANPSGKATAGK